MRASCTVRRAPQEVAGTKIYDDRRAQSCQILEDTQTKKERIEEVLNYIEERLEELEDEKEELKEYQQLDRDKVSLLLQCCRCCITPSPCRVTLSLSFTTVEAPERDTTMQTETCTSTHCALGSVQSSTQSTRKSCGRPARHLRSMMVCVFTQIMRAGARVVP